MPDGSNPLRGCRGGAGGSSGGSRLTHPGRSFDGQIQCRPFVSTDQLNEMRTLGGEAVVEGGERRADPLKGDRAISASPLVSPSLHPGCDCRKLLKGTLHSQNCRIVRGQTM